MSYNIFSNCTYFPRPFYSKRVKFFLFLFISDHNNNAISKDIHLGLWNCTIIGLCTHNKGWLKVNEIFIEGSPPPFTLPNKPFLGKENRNKLKRNAKGMQKKGYNFWEDVGNEHTWNFGKTIAPCGRMLLNKSESSTKHNFYLASILEYTAYTQLIISYVYGLNSV